MFNLKKKANCDSTQLGLDGLVTETEKLLKASQNRDFNITLLNIHPKLTAVIDNINQSIQNYSNLFQSELLKYKITHDALNMASWEMDVIVGDTVNPDNTFLWSKEFRYLLGYSTESEFPNVLNSWSDRLHPDDKEATLKNFNSHIIDSKGKAPYNLEYRLKLKNGEYEHFQAIGATLRNRSGVPLKVMGVIRNIQHEKIAFEAQPKLKGYEQLLNELRQMKKNIDINKDVNTVGNTNSLSQELKDVMDLVNDCLGSIHKIHSQPDFASPPQLGLWHVSIVDGDPSNVANKWYWSNEFRQLLGFSNEYDFPNTIESFTNILHPSEKESILGLAKPHLANKIPYDTVLKLMKKNGTYAYFHSYGSMIQDENGVVIRAMGAIEESANSQFSK